ncbi:MAG: 50S ribosomal protein L18e [Candidatus Marsarchaeota archaeon]|nr:50S ribosomal protein L18e [Candidatus Marsarchaeota archaeon]
MLALKRAGRRADRKMWHALASELDKSSRRTPCVNLSSIDRKRDGKTTVIVPGKVLGGGSLGSAVTVAALGFSSTAKKKIEKAGGRVFTLSELSTELKDFSDTVIIK